MTRCYSCKNEITSHTSEEMVACMTKMTDALNHTLGTPKLVEPSEEQAIEQFTNTKSGEPSRMGSR